MHLSSSWGNLIHIQIFGESHGGGIGVVLDGLPAGYPIDMDMVLLQMKRRAPGQDLTSTARKESDSPEVLSGMLDGRTTGAPVRVVKNKMAREYVRMEKRDVPLMELEKLTLGSLRRAVFDGDVDTGSLMAGQVAGMLHEIRPLRAILEEMYADYKATVAQLAQEV